MSDWIVFSETRPPDFTLIEVAHFAGRAELVYHMSGSNFVTAATQHKNAIVPDVWRLYTPPAAPAKLEMGETRFVPEPDSNEPSFLLVARDPVMPPLLEGWAYLRQGKIALARNALGTAMGEARRLEPQQPGDPQILSAFRIAQEARDWQTQKALAS